MGWWVVEVWLQGAGHSRGTANHQLTLSRLLYRRAHRSIWDAGLVVHLAGCMHKSIHAVRVGREDSPTKCGSSSGSHWTVELWAEWRSVSSLGSDRLLYVWPPIMFVFPGIRPTCHLAPVVFLRAEHNTGLSSSANQMKWTGWQGRFWTFVITWVSESIHVCLPLNA